MAGTTMTMTFTPASLADEYTCPVCMEDLYPAVAYQCLHKVCEACAPRCADCPKCKATGPPPRRDHDFGNLVEQQRSVAGFVCDTCFTSVSPEERSSHTCADALADRMFAMAASAGVARADLRVDAQTVIRAKQARPEMDRLEMDGMLTDLLLARSDRANAEAAAAARDAAAAAAADRAVLRAEVEAARQEAADAKAEADARQEAARQAEAAALQEAADAKAEAAANEALRIAAEAAVVHASPSAPAGRAAPSTALVLIDFDQVGTKDATQVLDLLTNMMDKLVRDGLAAGKAQVTLEAYGLCFSNKSNPLLIRNLTRLGVEMKTVSSAKKEETDRHIERAARATEAPVVVIVSSDQDFVATAKELGQSGKKAVLVHDARAGSSHEKLMGFYSDAWRCDYFVPGWGSRKYEAPTGRQASGAQASSWRNPANAASATIKIDGEDVPVSGLLRNKLFDEMRKSGRAVASWCTYAKCKKGLECTYAHRKPQAAAGAQASSSSQCRAQAPKATFMIQGKEVPTSELVKNGLFEVMKANPDHKAQWCPQREACKKGSECRLGHLKNEAQPASATLKIDGEDVLESSLMRNKMFDERNNGRTQFQWCNRRDCQEGLECTFAHRRQNGPARAQASELTFKILGKPVLASTLVKNAAYLAMKNNADHKVVWCKHRDACEDGLECTYAHRKPEAAAGAQASSPSQARAQTTELTFKIQGKDVPASTLVKNAAYLVMKENPAHKVIWCAHANCKKGLECTYAHRKPDAAAGAQTSELTFKILGKQVPASELVKNAAYLVMKNNPAHKVIWCRHRDACEDGLECTFAHSKKKAAADGTQAPKATFMIQGKEVPTSELVKNGLFEVMKANPDHKAQWCPQREACKKGSECRLGHLKNEAQRAGATLNIDGEDVLESSLMRNKMFDERNNGRTQFQWCNRRDCQEGLECTFAHRKQNGHARAQASELTFKILGKQVLASMLVKNAAYLAMKNNADHKVVWCKHRAACEDGLECTYAHHKPEAAAGAQASSPSQARAQTTELTFKILGKQVLASTLVKNAAYLAMKNNADHKVIWCKHRDACEGGLECTFAHSKKKAAPAGARASVPTFRIRGVDVPTSELVQNTAYHVMQANPAHKVSWCNDGERCQRGPACKYAHRK